MNTYIDYHDRPTWLAARPSFLGASESAALLGYGYANQNAASIFADKIAPPTDSDGTDAMTVGRLLETGLASVFSHFSGLPCELETPYRVRVHPEVPFIAATIDAWTLHDGWRTIPVELKNVDNILMRQWSEDNVAPLKFQIQVAHQQLVTGAPKAYLSGLIGGNKPVIREIPRNEDFIANLQAKLVEFWGFVERKELPTDWFEWSADATSDAIKRLHPMDNGETVMLPAEAIDWAEELAEVKERLKAYVATEKALKNRFSAAIGDATFGVLPDGTQFTLKAQTRKAYEVKECTFRVLRRSS